jgi:hypothetical protein
VSDSSPIELLARQRFILASADIEAQLNVLQGGQPIVVMLMLARGDAAAALTELAMLEEPDVEKVRALQFRIQQYDKIVHWLRTIMKAGLEFDREINQEDRDEMLDLLSVNAEGQPDPSGLQDAIDLGIVERKQYADS